jgi:hypothetical protein
MDNNLKYENRKWVITHNDSTNLNARDSFKVEKID